MENIDMIDNNWKYNWKLKEMLLMWGLMRWDKCKNSGERSIDKIVYERVKKCFNVIVGVLNWENENKK